MEPVRKKNHMTIMRIISASIIKYMLGRKTELKDLTQDYCSMKKKKQDRGDRESILHAKW